MLKIHLPAKEENVILVRLSKIQRDLYTQFMDRFRDCGNSGWLGLNPLKAFCVCCKVCRGVSGKTEMETKNVWGSQCITLLTVLDKGKIKGGGRLSSLHRV